MLTVMEYLALAAIVQDQATIVNEIIQLTAKHQCNIEECRTTTLGSDIGIVMLVAGNWSSIAKLESALAALDDKYEIGMQIKRSEAFTYPANLMPYLIQVVALDVPGLLYDIANFFNAQSIYINDMQSHPFKASYTDSPMTTISMSLSIPIDINISDLRERFMMLCDELNIDGIMEPEKR